MQDEAIQEAAEALVHEPQPEDEYLTFRLGPEEYAVPITRVKEIRAWEPVTRIPNSQPWECGLINVRGAIVPIMDLRMRLGQQNLDYTSHTVVVMFGIDHHGKEKVRGAVVDALSDVARFARSHIQPSPKMRQSASILFAQGVVEFQNRMIILLDLERALNWESAVES